MNYLSVEKISKSFGEKILFEDITFGIEKGKKTALIAKNGTGKAPSSTSSPALTRLTLARWSSATTLPSPTFPK